MNFIFDIRFMSIRIFIIEALSILNYLKIKDMELIISEYKFRIDKS